MDNLRRILILAFLAALAVAASHVGCSSSGSIGAPTPNSIPVAIEGTDIDSLDGSEGILVDSRFKYAFEDVDTATVTTSSLFMVKETDASVNCDDTGNALPATVGCTEWSDYQICLLQATNELDCSGTYHVCMTKDIKKANGQSVFSDVADNTFYTATCDWSVIYGGTCSTYDGIMPPPGATMNYSQILIQVPFTGWTDTHLECLFSEVYGSNGVSDVYGYNGADDGCISTGELGSLLVTCDLGASEVVECTMDSECTVNVSPSALCIDNQCEVPDCGSYFTLDCPSFTNETDCEAAFSHDQDGFVAQFRRCAWASGACSTSYVASNNAYECVYNAANDRSNTADGGAYACDYTSGSSYPCDTLYDGTNCSSQSMYSVTDVKAQMTHANSTVIKNRMVMCISHFATAADLVAGCFSEETYRTADDTCKFIYDSHHGLCNTSYDATVYNVRGVPSSNLCNNSSYPYYADKWKCRETYYYDSKSNKYNCWWDTDHCRDADITQCIQ